MSSSASTPLTDNHSSRTSLSGSNGQNDNDSDEVWDLLDALEHFNSNLQSSQDLDDGEMASLEEALAYDPVSTTNVPSYSPNISIASSGNLEPDNYDDNINSADIEVPHFPPLSETMLGNKENKQETRTSEPISQGVKENQERALLDMASKDRFQQLLKTHMGFTRFEEWINDEGLPGSKQLLNYYKDLRAYVTLFDEVKAVGSGLQDIYFDKQRNPQDSLPFRPSSYVSSLTSVSLGMHTAQEEATDRLYSIEFKRFITGKLTEQAKARLQFIPDHKKRGDLGEVFCIADPRLPDQPLVLISDAFCRLSEYPRDLLIGRNCRFLQGPETDKTAVRALRVAIEAGQEHCCLLLNYTRTGKPFWNLLNMIPLKGANGAVEYLLGAQIDVTSAMSGTKAFKNLQDLVTGGPSDKSGPVDRFGFSDDLINSTEKELSRPSIIRQIRVSSGSQSQIQSQPESSLAGSAMTPFSSYPGNQPIPNRKQSFAASLTSPKLSSDKKSSWLSKLKKGGDTDIAMDSYSPSIVSTPSNLQIPARIRDRMSTFSAAHSKMIIFDAKCGRIQYVTPPLLAYLRYPIRTHKDRLSSSLLRLDILDILTGANPIETKSITKSVRDIISSESTQSVYAGLLVSQSSRFAPDHIADDLTDSGKKYARSLLHLTPVKDRKNKSEMYVVVVG
ncbi:uncharacterized protein L201_006979 [Kwoniella dendrophila CBS 6074]|uniref:PAC domain-containing protein n=1 Tax=Kwoniella dendrophila CBS 6074 TaxID=1295534 RepID=A0AAX4K5E9_9TREE